MRSWILGMSLELGAPFVFGKIRCKAKHFKACFVLEGTVQYKCTLKGKENDIKLTKSTLE
jgi:hypothetical protein